MSVLPDIWQMSQRNVAYGRRAAFVRYGTLYADIWQV